MIRSSHWQFVIFLRLRLHIQIMWRRVVLLKILQLSLFASNLPTYVGSYAAIPSLKDLAIFMVPHDQAHSSDLSSGGPFCMHHRQAVRNEVQTFPEPIHLERDLPPICLANKLLHLNTALVLSAAPEVAKWSPIQVPFWHNFTNSECHHQIKPKKDTGRWRGRRWQVRLQRKQKQQQRFFHRRSWGQGSPIWCIDQVLTPW